MTNPLAAANAYAAISKATAGAGGSLGGMSQVAAGGGFGDMLEQAISSFAEQGRAADQKTAQAVASKGADVVDVVTAVAESELALDTLVSVRDKVIAAYEEIMRMPI